ncbi:CPCC family cysteine-rich protein [Dactylosporangium cerinum]|uniref:CPCC family cysteine-rich protein n=1 Tax=Dactylosporangium cerinum TaxID=1434730 RepID=A0ABV9W1Z6_9ACTN
MTAAGVLARRNGPDSHRTASCYSRRCRACGRLAGVGQPTLPRCACCGFRTGCTTCPICYWTDDGRSDVHDDVGAGSRNGDLSLADARLNFSIYGASTPRYKDLVRAPRADERP